MQIVKGMIVKSVAGHDRDSFYIVVDIDEEKAYIADGRRRKVQKPKAKSFSHLSPTELVLSSELFQTNRSIRQTLFEYLLKKDFAGAHD